MLFKVHVFISNPHRAFAVIPYTRTRLLLRPPYSKSQLYDMLLSYAVDFVPSQHCSLTACSGARPFCGVHVWRHIGLAVSRFHLHAAKPPVQSALFCRRLCHRSSRGVISHYNFIALNIHSSCYSGFEHQHGEACCDMALHYHCILTAINPQYHVIHSLAVF